VPQQEQGEQDEYRYTESVPDPKTECLCTWQHKCTTLSCTV